MIGSAFVTDSSVRDDHVSKGQFGNQGAGPAARDQLADSHRDDLFEPSSCQWATYPWMEDSQAFAREFELIDRLRPMFCRQAMEFVGALRGTDLLHHFLKEASDAPYGKSIARKERVRLNNRITIFIELQNRVAQLGALLWGRVGSDQPADAVGHISGRSMRPPHRAAASAGAPVGWTARVRDGYPRANSRIGGERRRHPAPGVGRPCRPRESWHHTEVVQTQGRHRLHWGIWAFVGLLLLGVLLLASRGCY